MGWQEQPTAVALLLSNLARRKRSSKVPGFKCFKNLWFQRLLHPVATNARWHRKWSTDIAELTEQHCVGNTCVPRLPNPNARKVTRQEISSIPPQSNLPLISSWVLFATTKACARFKNRSPKAFWKGSSDPHDSPWCMDLNWHGFFHAARKSMPMWRYRIIPKAIRVV